MESYEKIEMEVIAFEEEDVITASLQNEKDLYTPYGSPESLK